MDLAFYLFAYWDGNMNHDVDNPDHYNQNGIEVIDVIETYAKDDFRLANVIKYVCRCEYKGRKLQDLQKAAWYLTRVIDELEAEHSDDEEECLPLDEWTTKSRGYSPREVEVFFQGYECREQEEEEMEQALKENPPFSNGQDEDILFDDPDWRAAETQKFKDLYFHASPDRIAGDDAKASKIKDEYYGFNRYNIQGHCASCDAEIQMGQPFVTSLDYENGIKFCKQACVDSLRAWQKG